MRAASVSDFRELARRRLPHMFFEYIDGGSYAEATLGRNVSDFEVLALRQRVMKDMSLLDMSVETLGQTLKLPVGLWIYSFLVILAPILTPSPLWALTSFNRYMLGCFPLFFALGWVLAKSRLLLGAWLVASAGFGVYLTLLFVTWRWVA